MYGKTLYEVKINKKGRKMIRCDFEGKFFYRCFDKGEEGRKEGGEGGGVGYGSVENFMKPSLSRSCQIAFYTVLKKRKGSLKFSVFILAY